MLYVLAPISWTSNSWHFVGLVYDSNVSTLYLDGQAVAAGQGVSLWPSLEVLSNGMFVGSSATGGQMRGLMMDLATWSEAVTPEFFSNRYNMVSALISKWQGAQNATGGGVTMYAPAGNSGLNSLASFSCSPGGPVWLANPLATLISRGNVTLTFTLSGGASGALYDIYSTTNFTGPVVAGSVCNG